MAWNDGLAGVALQIAGTHDTPLRVMAGPGTGKSFAMKRRVARLLEEGTAPARILAVTFTRTAAASLIADLNQLGVPGCEDIRCGTLHSFCFWLLSKDDVFQFLQRVPRPLVTFNTAGVLQYEAAPLLEDICAQGDFGNKRTCTRRVKAFEAAWARLQSDVAGWPLDPVDRQFHDCLLGWLVFHRAMLIGELVPESLRYVRNNPLCEVRQAFDHVVVDEYQDLNKAEQELVDLLAENGDNSVVGDVDQSIYSFRHANPEGILQFSNAHPATHDETLAECRRCPTRVVDLADHLIRQNHAPGAGRRLNPMAGNPLGDVSIVQWESIEAEADGLAAFVRHLIDERHYLPGDILILCPRRLLGYGIRDALVRSAIPTHSFYHEESLEAPEAQEAFSLLRLFADPDDRVALRWWLGHGSPSWRRGEYTRLRQRCETTGLSPRAVLDQIVAGTLTVSGTAGIVDRYRELTQRLAAMAGMTVSDMAGHLFPTDRDWAKPLSDAAVLAVPHTATARDLLDALVEGITQPEMPEEGEFVRIMSLHKSKGLTSKAVIVAGCIEGLIPTLDLDAPPAILDAALQEQRRLFYVAVTRCREVLALSSVTSIPRDMAYRIGATIRGRYGSPAATIASRFINELGPTRPAPRAGHTWLAGGFA